MGSQKEGQDISFVGMSTGSRGVRVRSDSMVNEPLRAKGVVPLETPKDGAAASAQREAALKNAQQEAEQRLRERIREELIAEQAEALAAKEAQIRKEVREQLEKEMDGSKDDTKKGYAKASPGFTTIKPKADASENDLEDAIEQNSEDIN